MNQFNLTDPDQRLPTDREIRDGMKHLAAIAKAAKLISSAISVLCVLAIIGILGVVVVAYAGVFIAWPR